MKRLRIKVMLYKDRIIRKGQKLILGEEINIYGEDMLDSDIMEAYGRTLFKNLCLMIKDLKGGKNDNKN